MKIYSYTLGCKVNQYETRSILEPFLKDGYTETENIPDCDVAIINSCTVTSTADSKTRQILHRVRTLNPDCIIVLTGCSVQTNFASLAGESTADIIVGNGAINKIYDLVNGFKGDKIRLEYKHLKGETYNTAPITDFGSRTRAFMKIEDGCQRYCTYCAIPYARGFVRSRGIEDIKNEAQVLSQKGYSEIVLTGINLTAYGMGESYNICDAIEAVSAVDGIKRVRLGSLEPDIITDEMIERLKSYNKLCPQFHLSLQSGSDKILKAMNRHYDKAFYYDLVCRLRAGFENCAITTDVMVGFSGEGETEFNESYEFCRLVSFAKMHIFAYSRRPGTVADGFKGQITNKEKQSRSRKLAALDTLCSNEFLNNQLNRQLNVLFETPLGNHSRGFSENYCEVEVKNAIISPGEIKKVKPVSVNNGILEAILV